MIQKIFTLPFQTKIYLLIGSIVIFCVLYCIFVPFTGHAALVSLYIFPLLFSSLIQRPWIAFLVLIGSIFINAILYMFCFDHDMQAFLSIFLSEGGWTRLFTASVFSIVSYRFVSLYEALLESRQQFSELNEQLEKRVQERTVELQHVNQKLQSEYQLNQEMYHLKERLRNKVAGHSPEHIAKDVSLLVHSINNALMIVQGRIEIFIHRNHHLENIDSFEELYTYIQNIDTHLKTIKQYMNVIQLNVVLIDVTDFFQTLYESAKQSHLNVQFEILDEDIRLYAEKDSLIKGILYLFQYIQMQTSKPIPFMLSIKRDNRDLDTSSTNILIHIHYGDAPIVLEKIPKLIVDILEMQNLNLTHCHDKKIVQITL